MAKPSFIERARDLFVTERGRQTKFLGDVEKYEHSEAAIPQLRARHDREIREAEAKRDGAKASALGSVPGVGHLAEQAIDLLETGASKLDAVRGLPDAPVPEGSDPDSLDAYRKSLAAVPAKRAAHREARLAIGDDVAAGLAAIGVEFRKIADLRKRVGLDTPALFGAINPALIGAQVFLPGSARDATSVLSSVVGSDRISSPDDRRDPSNTVTSDLFRALAARVNTEIGGCDTALIAKAKDAHADAKRSENYQQRERARDQRKGQDWAAHNQRKLAWIDQHGSSRGFAEAELARENAGQS